MPTTSRASVVGATGFLADALLRSQSDQIHGIHAVR